MPTQEKIEKFKEAILGPKPQRTPKYAGGVRQWGWSSEIMYKWRHSSYDNIDKQLVSGYR
jgi:hypothetical protein